MQKTMKSSTAKVVIVNLNKKKYQVTVDAAVYDDIYIEAATRVVEKKKKDMSFFHKMHLIAECYEKADTEKVENHYQLNMYHVLMNAGLYSIAELLRTKAKNLHDVDIQLEPARANAGKSSNS
jgi:hypothetical protein